MRTTETHRPRRTRVLAVGLTAPLLLAGCSLFGLPDPILIGPVPAAATARIDLAIPEDPSGFFVFSRWPNACDLLNERDVLAVFPQATEIGSTPSAKEFKVSPNINGIFDAPYRPPFDVTVKNASCRLAFSLPGIDRADYMGGFQVDVAIDTAGTEEVVRDNYLSGKSGDEARASLGGAECVISTLGRFSCLKGKLAFYLSTVSVDQGKYGGKRTIQYQVGAQVSTFEATAGDAAGYGAIRSFENDHIRSGLATAVALKL